MATQMFVNLPVKDLNRSIAFFTELGFAFNPQFTDENATCMIVGTDSFVMLLVEPYFQSFIKKPVSDATQAAECIIAISADSKAAVDKIVDKALEIGGSPSNDTMDLGWMYNRSFQDLNGHLWEVAYMDMSAMPQG